MIMNLGQSCGHWKNWQCIKFWYVKLWNPLNFLFFVRLYKLISNVYLIMSHFFFRLLLLLCAYCSWSLILYYSISRVNVCDMLCKLKNAICKKLTWVTIVPVALYKGDMKVIYWSALVYMSLFYIVSVRSDCYSFDNWYINFWKRHRCSSNFISWNSSVIDVKKINIMQPVFPPGSRIFNNENYLPNIIN